MSQKIMIGNLPQDVTVEEITRVLEDAGIERLQLTLNNEGDATRVTAVLDLADADRPTADRIATRINGTRYRERTLTAYVPLFL